MTIGEELLIAIVGDTVSGIIVGVFLFNVMSLSHISSIIGIPKTCKTLCITIRNPFTTLTRKPWISRLPAEITREVS